MNLTIIKVNSNLNIRFFKFIVRRLIVKKCQQRAPPPIRENYLNNIYPELCSYENLEEAFYRARKGKTLKKYVIEFKKNLEENLLQIRDELIFHIYKSRSLKTFIIRDPKTRKISKSDFRDRIVHHAICNMISPFFEKRFISDSFANRIGKGSLNAIKRFDKFKKKVSKNNTRKCYVFKADIKHYFDNINHEILIKILRKNIKERRFIWLIKIILKNHKTQIQGKGMPLGNLTSQFFANVYLNELDQYVKHKLKVKYYIRYVDDFVILNRSRELLESYKEQINIFLKNNLDIELHPEKSKILKLNKGINFLGFKIFYYYKLIRKKNKTKFTRKIKDMRELYERGKIDREKLIEKFEGWLAYISNGDAYKYKKRLTSSFNKLFPINNEIEINSVKKHENFNYEIELSKFPFTRQKTLFLFKKGLTIKQIAERRKLKINTIYDHVSNLVEHHQILLKDIISKNKIKKIITCIYSPNDKLKEIKERVNDDNIAFNEINCVLSNLKGKHKKKSINYFIQWYKRTNCYRKCYFNKFQRNECRIKFQQLETKFPYAQFSKKGFLRFFNNKESICVLPEREKRKFISWREFKRKKDFHKLSLSN